MSTTSKNPTLLIAVALLFTSCQDLQQCNTEKNSFKWEVLPIAVSSDGFDSEMLDRAIGIFNDSIGETVLEIDNEAMNYINVGYKDFTSDGDAEIYGQTAHYLDDDTGFAIFANIDIQYGLDYDLMVNVLEHEFGHAIGHGGNDESGIMYCFTNDGMDAEEYEDAFINLKEWFYEIY